LKLATEKNEAEAQFLLGKQAYDLWKKDVRNEASYKESIKWLEKAEDQEYQAAIALLEEMKEIKEQENSGLDIFPAEIWQDVYSYLNFIETEYEQYQSLIEQQEIDVAGVLPVEIWQSIFSHLDCENILAARLVHPFW
ncbi:hypothetical protein GR268_47395, partial [Rhizobium leguminosarum]|nr:hypothetical protein [Rhizobium leguminosarum]